MMRHECWIGCVLFLLDAGAGRLTEGLTGWMV